MDFLVWSYGALHLPLIMGIMVWIFTQRRSHWTRFRNWFLAMNFMAVLLYFLLPTAPPRMIFTSGVVDISYLQGKRPSIFENGLLANPFAAMPSLHFAYALFVALALFVLAPPAWLRWGGFAYPALVLRRHRRHRQPLHRRRGRQRARAAGGLRPRRQSPARAMSRARTP